jgi:hypothetical protein
MSRAYRISVKESINRVIKAEDRVGTELEILEVLPSEQMAELLAQALEGQGFERREGLMVREQNGVTVTVDPRTGKVEVLAESSEQTEVQGEKTGSAWDDVGPGGKQVRENLREQLKKDLEKKVESKQATLQSQVTDRLEGELRDIREELDRVVNRVTAEALKTKAAQLGQIKEISEDPQAGSLTIVVEV